MEAMHITVKETRVQSASLHSEFMRGATRDVVEVGDVSLKWLDFNFRYDWRMNGAFLRLSEASNSLLKQTRRVAYIEINWAS
jgi:hypothetical protein